MDRRDTEVTGWVNWAYFAGIMMIILGIFQAIVGFVTIFNSNYLIIAQNHLLFFDLTTWAWAHFILGLIVIAAGFAVFSGQVWARTIGVIMACISAVANMAFIPAYPFWSTMLVVVDFLVIYALTVHGHELKNVAV